MCHGMPQMLAGPHFLEAQIYFLSSPSQHGPCAHSSANVVRYNHTFHACVLTDARSTINFNTRLLTSQKRELAFF